MAKQANNYSDQQMNNFTYDDTLGAWQVTDVAGSTAAAAGGGNNAYYAKPSGTNADGTVAYTSATTITVTGMPYTFTQFDIESIAQIPTSGDVTSFTDKADFAVAAGVITVTGATFGATDEFVVVFTGPERAYDDSQNLQLTQILNQDYLRYTDVTLVVTANDLTASYAKQGSTIAMQGYNILQIFIDADVNDSLNVDIKLMSVHTLAGTQYDIMPLSVQSLWTTVVADFSAVYQFEVDGLPYVDIMAIAGTAGATAGDLTINIVKQYIGA